MEVVVVLAILALFGAILFPAFAMAREKARQTACREQMHRVGMALIAYANDNDGRWPPVQDRPPWSQLQHYVLVTAADSWSLEPVFRCPGDGRENPPFMLVGGAPLVFSWGFRKEAFGTSNRDNGRSDFPVVVDYSGETGLWESRSVASVIPYDRHNGWTNVLLHDGHATCKGTDNFCQEVEKGRYSRRLGEGEH